MSKIWCRIGNLYKTWRWWLACLECPLAGLMLRDSALLHAELSQPTPTKNSQNIVDLHWTLQLLFSLRIFLVQKFQIVREFRFLIHWVFGSSLTPYFWSCNEPTIYSHRHLYLQINATSQSFHSRKEPTS